MESRNGWKWFGKKVLRKAVRKKERNCCFVNSLVVSNRYRTKSRSGFVAPIRTPSRDGRIAYWTRNRWMKCFGNNLSQGLIPPDLPTRLFSGIGRLRPRPRFRERLRLSG
uniref:Uncharacterized protein n=1 Tax=Candidatus Kentrum sp. SD TaxID=2126332 RepID=A0A450YHI8_9GAMM|nr:MAG: hypothetical protein BECKSD772E_GA0070983_10099 [Candidatus Kentron sp. SD]